MRVARVTSLRPSPILTSSREVCQSLGAVASARDEISRLPVEQATLVGATRTFQSPGSPCVRQGGNTPSSSRRVAPLAHGGDSGDGDEVSCPAGYVLDCTGEQCAEAGWLGDGFCDNDPALWDLNCGTDDDFLGVVEVLVVCSMCEKREAPPGFEPGSCGFRGRCSTIRCQYSRSSCPPPVALLSCKTFSARPGFLFPLTVSPRNRLREPGQVPSGQRSPHVHRAPLRVRVSRLSRHPSSSWR